MLSTPAALVLLLLAAPADMPEVKDDRLQLQLVAEAPDIVTPTGLAVDAQGRVLVIESHTHFRPEGYRGPEKDRILLMDRFGDDGKAGRIRTWYAGTTHTMNIAVHPNTGDVFVATRNEIFTLRDTNEDDVADLRTPLCHLETKGNYPHNGLSGFAFQDGKVYFGFGENLGADYQLIGSDGRELAGGGEGGNVYCCQLDGSKLHRVATGFWNPFHVCFDAKGNLFTVDNDPDSRPPCRLLHVVEGGDYGFRFRHGRKGTNPLTAWNGELPGTLPMVAGTGEAPSAVLSYEGRNLPDGYQGQLLVTSWGDHRIEAYRLEDRSGTFVGAMTPVVVGGDQFRPVGMAMTPGGSLFFSDWVDKSYQLHGKGRVWRLSAKQPRGEDTKRPASAEAISPNDLQRLPISTELTKRLQQFDLKSPFVAAAFAANVRQQMVASGNDWPKIAEQYAAVGIPADASAPAMLALWRGGFIEGRPEWLAPLLTADDPRTRLAAVLVVAEYQLKQFRPQVEEILSAAETRQMFEVCLSTLDTLDRSDSKPNDWSGEVYAIRTLKSPTAKPEVRALALRVLRSDHPELTPDFLLQCLGDKSSLVRLEAIRTARQRSEPALRAAVAKLALDETAAERDRAEAVLGLDPQSDSGRSLLSKLAIDSSSIVSAEALRMLRQAELSTEHLQPIKAARTSRSQAWQELAARVIDPKLIPNTPAKDDLTGWMAWAEGPGDSAAGERIFFSSQSVGCARCHEHEGRGATVGPELSTIARTMQRERLVQSIVLPSKEMAPQFTPWVVALDDGRSLTGLYAGEEVDGTLQLADNTGKLHRIHPRNIEERRTSPESIMPAGLAQQLTQQEWRDLLAFLLKQN